MIRPQEILNYMRAEPFRLLRVRMMSGQTFDIHHPEMIRVGTDFILVFTYLGASYDIHERLESASLMLIESISHLETPAA